MTRIFVSADFYKSHVAAYTKKDGTFVAEHDDKRRKHADVKPEHLYGMLADAEDSGGRAAVHELAHDVIKHRPDLERAVRGAASDVGHSLPGVSAGAKEADAGRSGVSAGSQKDSGHDHVWGGHDVADRIAEAIKDDPGADWGLRVIPHGHPVREGDELPPSYRWDDGNQTDEELEGTSVIGIRANGGVDRAIKVLNQGGYLGPQVALVRGESQGAGEDPGEVLLSDSEVVLVWDNPSTLKKSHPPLILFVKSRP